MTISARFPASEHDARLLANVAPSGWQNPAPAERYHLVVIGAGTAGLVAAAGAAGLGARVALVERNLMGGDCLNTGCVPSKGVIAAARSWHAARESAGSFGGPAVAGPGSFSAALERMRRLRAEISHVDSAARFRDLGVDVFLGNARFVGPEAVQVGDQTLRFRRAVIATGARAAAPPIPGLAESEYLTNESIFDLTTAPEHLLVLGAGPIGCEMAQSFARLGSRVTLLDMAPRVLPRDDADAAAIVARALEADGVRLVLDARIERVELVDGLRRIRLTDASKPAIVEGDTLLVAAGRAPNIEGLGLDAAGVEATAKGIVVDDRLRTSNARIYAIGDVASPFQFTHAADFQARAVLANALFFGRSRASRLIIPWVTYTSPEVAQVGLTAGEAEHQGVAVETITVPLADNDRAVLAGESEGFFRVHLKPGSDTILGITIVASHAGDLISEGVVAMTNGLGLGAIGKAIHPYPTTAEVYRRAADQWRRGKLTPLARKALSAWFRIFS